MPKKSTPKPTGKRFKSVTALVRGTMPTATANKTLKAIKALKKNSDRSRTVKFTRGTNFLGRNGYLRSIGVEVYPMPEETLDISPITSKNEVGRCKIIIPKEDAVTIALAILAAAGTQTEVCAYIPASTLIPKGWAEKGFWDLVTKFSYGDNNRSLVTASEFANHCEESLASEEENFPPRSTTRFLNKIRALGETYIDLEN